MPTGIVVTTVFGGVACGDARAGVASVNAPSMSVSAVPSVQPMRQAKTLLGPTASRIIEKLDNVISLLFDVE
jgi:hypothetical protein